MKRTFARTALALALVLPFGAGAAELSYTYLEGGFTDIEADGGSDADGWGVGGSVALGDQFHLFGSHARTELDSSSIDADITRLGLGWRTPVSDASDLVVRANYTELDSNFTNADSDGYEAEVGLRTAHGERFESYAAAGYIDVDRGDGDLYGKLGAQYKFTPQFGLVASATLSEDANEFFFGPRLSF